MGGEIKKPGRNRSGSIIISFLLMMLLYVALNIDVVGVVSWQTVANSTSIASLVLERTWGRMAIESQTISSWLSTLEAQKSLWPSRT
jgi:amino acid transporter